MYELAAWIVVVLHFGYLVYAAFGGFLALRGIGWLWPHLASSAWSIAVTLTPLNCPATAIEKWLWRQAGETPYDGSFIQYYLTGHVYPVGYDTHVWVGGGIVALGSYLLVYVRQRGGWSAAEAGGQ